MLPVSRYLISGHSMEPTLPEGKVVWVFHWAYFFTRPKVGDVILFNKEGQGWLKRITKISDPSIWVEGDNYRDSWDSRGFGPINQQQILGKVVFAKTKRKL